MTTKQFFANIEGYYGKYPRTFLRQEVAAYVATIPEAELAYLYSYIKHSISTRFGATPDIEAIETARKEIYIAGKGEIKPHVKQLPDPTAKSMKIEVGDMMKRVLERVKG